MSRGESLVLGLHHPGVVVPDLDRAIEFYTKLLGFELFRESSWQVGDEGFDQVVGLRNSAARFCMLKGSNTYIELFEYSAPAPTLLPSLYGANEPGIRHLAFAVTDVQTMLEQCVELGGSKINEPFHLTGGATAAYCRDPFGNLLEFVKPGGRFPPLIDTDDTNRATQ